MDREFVDRLKKTFDSARMSDVARLLDIPHATVRNYYHGRLPAPDVLIKIARQTGVSLNWLLLGTGEMYANAVPVSFGRIVEEKIEEIIERKLAQRSEAPKRPNAQAIFDVESAVSRLDDPQSVMREWFAFEGRSYPDDYGIVFFRGWESFTPHDKAAAVRDAKQMIDRVLRNEKHA